MTPQPPKCLIVACDVDYRSDGAMAAAVWFRGWDSSHAQCEETAFIQNVAAYQPGEFYKRELPCLLEVLKRGPEPDVIVVDGYVWLHNRRPGLGAHLYQALSHRIAVIGVAKTRFAGATDALPILRGISKSPLYISAAGMDLQKAVDAINQMSGPRRIPTLLKRPDQLARRSFK